MIHRIFAVVFAGLLIAAAPKQAGLADVRSEPRAASWAISVTLASAGQVLQIGQAGADSGAQPNAVATAFMAGGQGTGAALADAAHPDVVKDFKDFTDPAFPVCAPPIPQATLNNGLCDPGGNFSFRGGYAEAHVAGGSATSLAGIASGNGNGFAFASKNFSFAQQSQVLNAVQQLDNTLSAGANGLPGVNTLIDQLNAATGTLPKLSHVSGPPPAGLIDIADTGAISATAQTSAEPGFVSATSSSSLGLVKLLGGFIELHGVKADADSESNSGNDSRTAKATIGSMTIAGLSVVGDSDGLHLASNDLITRAAVQPALDQLMAALQSSGLTLTFASTKALGDLREATALDLQWITPNGLVHISVGHADASAQTVGAPFPVPPVVSGFVPPPIPPVAVPPAITPPVSTPPFVTPPTTTGGQAGKFFYRRPGADVARALHTVYLIFLVGGFVGSLMYPMLIRRAPRARRRPLFA